MVSFAPPSLLGWLDAPSSSRGIAFAEPDGWSHVDYAALAGRVALLAGGLKERGVRPDDVVNLILPNGREFIELFLATLVCGATASPVAPPSTFTGSGAYREHLTAIVRLAQPRLVVCEASDLAEVRAVVGEVAIHVREDLAGTAEVHPGGRLADLALLQYTSGTSGSPKAVMVGWDQL